MDHRKLEDEVKELVRIKQFFCEQMRAFGLELSDLPEDVMALLNDCTELKMATDLFMLRESYVKEYYYTRKKQLIENTLAMGRLKAELDELDHQVDAEQEECDALEKFLHQTKTNNCSEAELEHSKVMLEAKVKDFQEKQKSLKTPKDLNIDALVHKIQQLEAMRKQKEGGK